MQIAIITSNKDPAGMNIKETLLQQYVFKELDETFMNNSVYAYKDYVKLYTLEDETIFHENIDKEINADLFIFATKHQGKAGIKTLSCHSPGNWSKAEFGGEDRKLCVAPANFLKEALVKLEEYNNLGYDVVQEITHHGGFLEKPSMFIEIGSTKNEWVEKEPAQIISKVIMYLLDNCEDINKKQYKTAAAIGGLHTMPNFKKIILNTDIAIGHCCPKYMLEFLDKDILEQAVGRSEPKAELIILDWKGLGGYKEKVKQLCEEIGLEVKRTKEF